MSTSFAPVVTPTGASTYGSLIGSLSDTVADGSPEYIFVVNNKGEHGKQIMRVLGGKSVKFAEWMDAWRLHLEILKKCDCHAIVLFGLHGMEIQYRAK